MKKQGKKILIGVLITILIGGLIFVCFLNYHNQLTSINESGIGSIYPDENIMNDIENAVEEHEEVIISNADENNLTENQKENIIKQDNSVASDKETTTNDAHTSNKVPIINKDNKTKEQDNTSEQQKDSDNKQFTEQQSTSNENKTPSVSQNENKEQNKETEVKQEEKKEEKTQEKQEDKNQVVIPPTPEEPKVEETKEESKEESKQENPHTYKYNAAITEQIKQDILNNESDYMKQYGYTIIIDESIVNLTNQFTYTNIRVKNMIIKKFGTIRIYARDYYYNGEYMFTECYLI